ncbi:MAG: AIR synthase-related protein, partial [Bacteroidales bacterium]
STALKRDLCTDDTKKELYNSMRELNKNASELIEMFPVNSCTDVTGFGLLGHLKEICAASNVSANIYQSQIPLLTGVDEFAADGIIPGGTENNYKYLKKYVQYEPSIPVHKRQILADAQTSGGLLFTVPEDSEESIIKKFEENKLFAKAIGRIIPSEVPLIKVFS